jgi:hypothetical protein
MLRCCRNNGAKLASKTLTGSQAREGIAAQESPWISPGFQGLFLLEQIERKRCIISFVTTHWSQVSSAAVILGIVVVVPSAVAGYGFVKFLRDLFHKPPR